METTWLDRRKCKTTELVREPGAGCASPREEVRFAWLLRGSLMAIQVHTVNQRTLQVATFAPSSSSRSVRYPRDSRPVAERTSPQWHHLGPRACCIGKSSPARKRICFLLEIGSVAPSARGAMADPYGVSKSIARSSISCHWGGRRHVNTHERLRAKVKVRANEKRRTHENSVNAFPCRLQRVGRSSAGSEVHCKIRLAGLTNRPRRSDSVPGPVCTR